MCNLIWCYVDMLVCFAWIVAQLLDQRPSFLAVERHISVLNKSLPRFPLFHYQRLCEFVSCSDGVCGEGVLFVQLDVFIVLLCQVCGESRDIVLSASPWNMLSGCRMNNLYKAIIIRRKRRLPKDYTDKGPFTIVNIFLLVQRVLILRPPSPSPN